MVRKKIYIAGPGVFRPDAVEHGEECKKICERYGFEGLYPFDNVCTTSNEIAMGNYGLIDQADIVVADINPFRGHEMDSGTAAEIGYAFAKGKEIYCYITDNRSLIERIGKVDDNGMSVEDFNLPVNLMIGEVAKIIKGNFEDCVKSI